MVEDIPQDVAQNMMMRNRQREDSLIIYQLSADDILAEIEHYLRAEEYDGDSDQWVRKKIRFYDKDKKDTFIKPIANEEGTNRIMSELRPRVHRIMTLSNFREDDIVDMMLWEVQDVLIDLLENKSQDFGIDKVNLPNIVTMVDHLLQGQFYRALNEGERRRIYPSQQTVQFLNQDNQQGGHTPQQQKGGGFNPFSKLFGRR